MASLALQLKSNPIKPHHYPTLISFSHFFSTSSDNNDNGNDGNAPQKVSDIFSDIKSNLNQPQQNAPRNPDFYPGNIAGFDEIRKNLSEFRLRSFPESGSPANSDSQNPNPLRGGGTLSFDSIRQSLKKLGTTQVDSGRNVGDRLSSKSILGDINSFDGGRNAGNRFSLKSVLGDVSPDKNVIQNNNVIGGGFENLPEGVFGNEMKEEEKQDEKDESRFELVRTYHYEELGKELMSFRPDVSKLGGKKGKKDGKEGEEGWFSLSELRERIGKLKDKEEKLANARSGGLHMSEMRKTLKSYRLAEREQQMTAFQRFDLLGSKSVTVGPPKENLIEKYFHPDNMSAAEKLKLELKKVRDEFKISESDCGSARVQIAQLTTEIRHLSSVLHKKDKHSRKGLLAKVQQRKKLLKYLRRTDWDSYCFVLSKLGLRDNPDYKNM